MKITDTSDLWWKTAVIYCLDIETYMDWDGDGRGDIEGLTHRLDHLADLGVTCIWLMPFYPTPGRDDGYDVADFLDVDGRLGDLGRLVELLRTAKDRGMRVIVDLVVNHTSDQHPWFKAARRGDPLYEDYYVWRDEKPDDDRASVFPGEESGVWSFDEKAGRYYLHNFYSHQPELNIANPRVRDEIARVMGFWVQLGISGFRVDAVPFFLEGADDGAAGDPHEHLRDLRRFLQRRASEAVLLGEVNLPYEQQLDYFGGGDDPTELTLQFDFVGMQALYLSLARQHAGPLTEALRERPRLPDELQWANFVRNHDELTLDKLSDDERQEVFDAFGPEPEMQVYGRGIVRRLPSMLDGDPRRIRMVYSLLFSLPGTPVLFYGEEIGMAENLDLDKRAAVRTPMQWSAEKNGGFSAAARSRLVSQPPEGGYGPEHVNVAQQRHDLDSLLAFMKVLTTRYRSSSEIGWGALEILEHDEPAVFAHAVAADTGRMVAAHNFSPEATVVTLDIGDEPEGTVLTDLLQTGEVVPDARGRVEVELAAYGARWMRVRRPGDRRLT